jgi:glycosyltransferase involved in cell wall biosynthesis
MTKNKVIILGKLPPPFMGPAIATEILLKSELKNRFDLIHLDTKINNTLTSLGKWNFGKLFKNIGIYFKLIKLLIKYKPNLVLVPISQTTMGFIKDSIFVLLSSSFGKKILIQLRGSNLNNWLLGSSKITKAYFKFVLKRTQGVIVLGNNLKYLFKDIFNEKDIYVIPNGGNYTITKIDKDNLTEIKILYFSNLLESKGIEDVFNAIAILSKDSTINATSFSVDVVGEWYSQTIKERCLNLAKIEHLPIRVHLPKSGNDKYKFFSEADIFVFPPRDPEGHPWAIIEAMAASLPIISTDRGAITESVINMENGFIIEARKPELIAEKLKLLIENAELRKKMGEASHKLYLANFTEEKMIDNYTFVFNTIIHQTANIKFIK